MISIKQYIANMFVGKSFHFKCDCLMPIDVTGNVVDTDISRSEIVLIVNVNNKLIHIGLNTPSLMIEECI